MEQALLQFSQFTGIFAFMNSPWGWPVVESLHFFGLSLLIGTVGVFDLRMLGFGAGISYQFLHRLVPIGVFGYTLNVTTGTMFSKQRTRPIPLQSSLSNEDWLDAGGWGKHDVVLWHHQQQGARHQRL
jgi:hypothetical protein